MSRDDDGEEEEGEEECDGEDGYDAGYYEQEDGAFGDVFGEDDDDEGEDYGLDAEATLGENSQGIDIPALIAGVENYLDEELTRELYCEGEGMHGIFGAAAKKKANEQALLDLK